MNNPPIIIGIGELLWDMLPSGKKLGGAPANVVYHSRELGMKGRMISRIGDDDLGKEAMHIFNEHDIPTDILQIDSEHDTGTVEVTLHHGKPSYVFTENAAWDFLEWKDEYSELAKKADVVIFGTLAQRSPQSRETIQRFLTEATNAKRICDINIRTPHISAEILAESLKLANIIKLNDDEIEHVCDFLYCANRNSLVEQGQSLLTQFDAELVSITRGGDGSILITPDEVDEHEGFPVEVKDTVGSGDAYTAAMVYHLTQNSPVPVMNAAANRLGHWVATHSGAMPPYTDEIRNAVWHPDVA